MSRKPVETRLAPFEMAVIALTAAARPAASRFAVDSAHDAGDGVYTCALSSGIASGSSGASFANASARSTTAFKEASSREFVAELAERWPNALRTGMTLSWLSPDVDA